MTNPDSDATHPSSRTPRWRRWWMLVIYAFVGLIVLSAVFAPDEDDDDTEETADRDTTTTEDAPATESDPEPTTTTTAEEEPAADPIELTGSGTTNSDPVTLSGDYTTTTNFGSCPVVDTWLKPVDAPDDALRWHQVSEGEGNVYGVEDGEYFVAVISCPEQWTVTLTPR